MNNDNISMISKQRDYVGTHGELFAEQFQKFSVRDFTNNTRLNIKNADWAAAKQKRERSINYWQNQVI